MNEAGVEGPRRQQRGLEDAVLRVQQHDAELLDGTGAVARQQEGRDLPRRSHPLPVISGAAPACAGPNSTAASTCAAFAAPSPFRRHRSPRDCRVNPCTPRTAGQDPVRDVDRVRVAEPVTEDDGKQLVVAQDLTARDARAFRGVGRGERVTSSYHTAGAARRPGRGGRPRHGRPPPRLACKNRAHVAESEGSVAVAPGIASPSEDDRRRRPGPADEDVRVRCAQASRSGLRVLRSIPPARPGARHSSGPPGPPIVAGGSARRPTRPTGSQRRFTTPSPPIVAGGSARRPTDPRGVSAVFTARAPARASARP